MCQQLMCILPVVLLCDIYLMVWKFVRLCNGSFCSILIVMSPEREYFKLLLNILLIKYFVFVIMLRQG